MRCFRLMRESGCLVDFHSRSAFLRIFLTDLVCSLSHGLGLNLGDLDLKGAMEFRIVRQLLLKLSTMVLILVLVVIG